MSKKKNPNAPDFRSEWPDPLSQAIEDYYYNQESEHLKDYGKVIVWFEKSRPIKFLEYLFKEDVISTWPPNMQDQHALTIIRKLWCKAEFLRMQIVQFSKKRREHLFRRPELGRIERWIYTYLDNYTGKYAKTRNILSDIKRYYPSNNVIPHWDEFEKLPPEKQTELSKKQKTMDFKLWALVNRVRKKWNYDRRKQRKENPSLGHGQRRVSDEVRKARENPRTRIKVEREARKREKQKSNSIRDFFY